MPMIVMTTSSSTRVKPGRMRRDMRELSGKMGPLGRSAVRPYSLRESPKVPERRHFCLSPGLFAVWPADQIGGPPQWRIRAPLPDKTKRSDAGAPAGAELLLAIRVSLRNQVANEKCRESRRDDIAWSTPPNNITPPWLTIVFDIDRFRGLASTAPGSSWAEVVLIFRARNTLPSALKRPGQLLHPSARSSSAGNLLSAVRGLSPQATDSPVDWQAATMRP